jgi:hypothetical protein
MLLRISLLRNCAGDRGPVVAGPSAYTVEATDGGDDDGPVPILNLERRRSGD